MFLLTNKCIFAAVEACRAELADIGAAEWEGCDRAERSGHRSPSQVHLRTLLRTEPAWG